MERQGSIAGSIALSAAFGVVFSGAGASGLFAGTGAGTGVARAALDVMWLSFFAAPFGIFGGLLASPAMAFVRDRFATRADLLLILGVTTVWSFAAGVAAQHVGGWVACMGVAIAGYLVTCAVVGNRARRRWLRHMDSGRCRACGYSMAGLAAAVCPECGGSLV